MSKRPNNQKTVKGPNVMPAGKRAPNPRTPKPAPNVRSSRRKGGDAGGEATTTAEDAQATMGTVNVPANQ